MVLCFDGFLVIGGVYWKQQHGKGSNCVKKVIFALAAAGMLLGMGPKVRAAEESGSIRVDIVIEELAVTNGALTLYRVGFPVQEGYRITESFGGGIVQSKDAQSPHLAQWLAQMTEGDGEERLLDADGDAVFSDLEDGLYLVMQTEKMDGFYPMGPQLVTVPQGEMWDVEVQVLPLPIVADNPRTGEGPGVFLWMIGMMGSGLGIAVCVRKRKSM